MIIYSFRFALAPQQTPVLHALHAKLLSRLSFFCSIVKGFFNTNTIYNGVAACWRGKCRYSQASKGLGYLFSRCLGRCVVKGAQNLSRESLKITQQLLGNKEGNQVTPGLPSGQGFCPISSESCWKFIIMTYLWKFSTSSTVSGKTLPLVSGRSSTNPPAIKPRTALKQRHKELVSIYQALSTARQKGLVNGTLFCSSHKMCTSSLYMQNCHAGTKMEDVAALWRQHQAKSSCVLGTEPGHLKQGRQSFLCRGKKSFSARACQETYPIFMLFT